MHDMDRTRAEYEGSYEAQEAVGYELGEGELGEGEGEFGSEVTEGPFSEQEEIELASELLEVSNEAELDRFLGNLMKRVARGASKIVRGPLGQQLGGMLKQVARKALPMAGAALGNMIVPGIGGAIGGKLASAAGSMFGLELEGLSNEDREFEVARRFVRFAGAATTHARRAPNRIPPRYAVRRAAVAAARRYAPGVLQLLSTTNGNGAGTCTCGGQGVDAADDGDGIEYVSDGAPTNSAGELPYFGGSARTGRWFRRGHRIIIVGI